MVCMNAAEPVLCLPHNPAAFSEMLEVVSALAQSGRYNPIFVFDGFGYRAAVQVCKEQGVAYRLVGKAPARQPSQSAESALPTPARSTSPVKRLFAWGKHRFFTQLAIAWLQYGHARQSARHLLDEINPQALLLIGDRHIGIETALVALANRRGIPSLIIPYALSDQEGAMLYRLAMPDWRRTHGMASWLNPIVARLRPGWSYTQDDLTLLWQPPAALLAAALWKMMPADPWVLGGGAAWAMVVESQHSKDNFILQGMPDAKITVTGKPRYDRAAKVWQQRDEVRQRLCAGWGVDPEKKLLVCAVPHFGEHDLLPWDQHWAEIEFLFNSFTELLPHTNVVLSLHPKSDLAQYAPRAEQHGLVIATQRYDQLIPISDVFVASYSSTVTLAIAAHIPAIVVDFHGFDYDFFDDVKGIVVAHKREEYISILKRMLSDKDDYQQLVDGQIQAAQYWARFDGKATQRILDFMDELIARGEEIRKLPARQRRTQLPPWSQ